MKLIKDLGTRLSGKTYRGWGLYECDCGNRFESRSDAIKSGRTIRCKQCKSKFISEKTKESKTTHGLTNSRLYRIWCHMKERCNTESCKAYVNYGARGIKVCDEWNESFTMFYVWSLANGYSDDLTIDRIDNNKGYSKDNCRWTTREVQSRNTRVLQKNNTTGYRGVVKKGNKFNSRITVDSKLIHIGYYSSAKEAAKAYDKYVTDNNLEHTRNFK